jgi:hypothetical protein
VVFTLGALSSGAAIEDFILKESQMDSGVWSLVALGFILLLSGFYLKDY